MKINKKKFSSLKNNKYKIIKYLYKNMKIKQNNMKMKI